MNQHLSSDEIVWPCSLSEQFKQQLLNTGELYNDIRRFDPSLVGRGIKGVYYLHKGVVTAYTSSEDTRFNFTVLLGPGDWFGAVLLAEHPDILMSAEQLEPLEFLFFPHDKLNGLTEVNLETYKWLYHATGKTQAKLLQAQFTSLYDREHRVVYALLDLLAQRPVISGTIPRLRVTQSQLSLICGMTRPRVNEMLKELERANEIKLERNSVSIIDVKALQSRLDDESLIFRDPRKFIGQVK